MLFGGPPFSGARADAAATEAAGAGCSSTGLHTSQLPALLTKAGSRRCKKSLSFEEKQRVEAFVLPRKCSLCIPGSSKYSMLPTAGILCL